MDAAPTPSPRTRPTGGSAQVDRALILRLRIYLLIFGIAAAVTVVQGVRRGEDALWPVVLGLVGGVLVGVVVSRVSRLSWDQNASKVVGRIDALGAIVLIAYLLLVIFKKRLLAQWFDPTVVGVAAVAVLAGLMLGQALGTAGGIARVMHAAIGHRADRSG